MPRIRNCMLIWAICAVLLTGAKPAAEVRRLGETLLPETTQGFFAISSVDLLSEHWKKTQLGQLMADPVMEPFAQSIQHQVENRWSSIYDRFAVTLEDMRDVAGGDACMGLISPKPGVAALAIVVDVTGKLAKAKELIERATAIQLQRGAKQSEVKIEGLPDAILQFDLPEPEEDKEAGRAETAKDTDDSQPECESSVRHAFYCLTGNLLVMTDHRETIDGILGRAMGKLKGDSLADHAPFQFIVERCRKDYDERVPQIRWFIHPLGYAEAVRAATPEGQRRKGKSIIEVLRNQGIGGVQGLGGFADFSSEGYELVHRTTIYAPPPYRKSLKMAVLPNHGDFVPQPWVPADVATYTTLYFDILNAFDNFGSLFNELFGQGQSGVWEETLLSLKEDPNGPQIDLRADLVNHLGQRVSVLTDYRLPITTASDRLMFVIDVTNPKAVAVGLEKLFKNDPTVVRRELDGQIIWEFVEDEEPQPTAPEISFGDIPPVAAQPKPKDEPAVEEPAVEDEFEEFDEFDEFDEFEEEEEERKRLLPHAAVTVWRQHLIIASHRDFLLKMTSPKGKSAKLADAPDYRLVMADIDKFQTKEKCFRFFSRTDEEYRPTYELIRRNKMPEGESLFARMLNVLFGGGKKGSPRTQKIDGSTLPDYEMVRRYLGPAGMQITSEPKGWFLKGFTLTKPATESEEPATESEKSATEPDKLTTKPEKSATKPEEPATKQEKPATKQEKPATQPDEPTAPQETPTTEPEQKKPAAEDTVEETEFFEGFEGFENWDNESIF